VGLAGRVLALTGGQHLAQDGFLDLGLVDAGAGHHGLDHGGAQVMRGGVANEPLKLPTAVRPAATITTLVM
jgi:hypothetical protein